MGSYNLDMTFKLNHFPIPGETVFAQEVRVGHGERAPIKQSQLLDWEQERGS